MVEFHKTGRGKAFGRKLCLLGGWYSCKSWQEPTSALFCLSVVKGQSWEENSFPPVGVWAPRGREAPSVVYFFFFFFLLCPGEAIRCWKNKQSCSVVVSFDFPVAHLCGALQVVLSHYFNFDFILSLFSSLAIAHWLQINCETKSFCNRVLFLELESVFLLTCFQGLLHTVGRVGVWYPKPQKWFYDLPTVLKLAQMQDYAEAKRLRVKKKEISMEKKVKKCCR